MNIILNQRYRRRVSADRLNNEDSQLVVIRNLTGDFREAPQGSAALTGITRVGIALNGIFRRRQLFMIPYQEMAACQTDILLLSHCVPPAHNHIIPNT